jgi:hypothetical protein
MAAAMLVAGCSSGMLRNPTGGERDDLTGLALEHHCK